LTSIQVLSAGATGEVQGLGAGLVGLRNFFSWSALRIEKGNSERLFPFFVFFWGRDISEKYPFNTV